MDYVPEQNIFLMMEAHGGGLGGWLTVGVQSAGLGHKSPGFESRLLFVVRLRNT